MMAGLLGGFLFSGIGFIAFKYGRSRGGTRAMALGVALMVYPYFMPNTVAVYAVGAALVATLILFRD